MTTSLPDIAELGTILGIWAHPDDEAYLSGGLMAMAGDAGSRVVCVTATRGELGTTDPQTWPPQRLAAQRSGELARCLGLLGVAEHHWLGYGDGRCTDASATEAITRLSDLVDEVNPDTVLSFGPDGFTGHPDHQTVGSWTAAAFDKAARPGARLLQVAAGDRRNRRWKALNDSLGVFEPGYPITVPDEELALQLLLDPRVADRKVLALQAQTTQTSGLLQALGIDCYTDWVSEEAFVERARGSRVSRRCPAPQRVASRTGAGTRPR